MKTSNQQIDTKPLAQSKGPFFKIALTLFVAFLIFTIYIANTGLGSTYFSFLRYIPGGDKTGHFFLMGTFCFLANSTIGYKHFTLHRLSALKGTSIVFLIVLLEECSQYFIKSRTFDLEDLAADVFGIIVFDLIYRFLSNRRQ